MQLKFLAFTVALLSVLLAFPTTAHAADTVQLVSGDLFTGVVLRVTDKEVSIRLDSGGIVTFQIQSVQKIRRWLPGKNAPEIIVFDHSRRSDVDDDGKDDPIGSDDLPPVLDPVDVPTKKVEKPENWFLEPPPGFKVVENQKASEDGAPIVLQTWGDPTVVAKVVLSINAAATSNLETMKAAALKPLTETKGFRVIRDQAVERGGEGGYTGWILEVEHALGGTPSRQLTMFVTWNERVFQLTFTCGTNNYPALARFFEESMESFRLFDRDEKPKSDK